MNNPKDRLIDYLPLEAPWGLSVDPSNTCNFKCQFCPTGNKGLTKTRRSGLMPFELFKKIIDDLKAAGTELRALKLWKDGEPLLNKDLPKFISYAKEKGVAKQIRLNTNGSLLHVMAQDLIQAGLDWIMISYISPKEDVYLEYTGTAKQKTVFNNISLLKQLRGNAEKPHIAVKICKFPLVSDEDIEQFKREFNGIVDEIIVHEEPINWDNSHDQDLTLGKAFAGENAKIVCPYPWYELNVNFDGQVSVCPVDWSLGTIIGDLKKETIYEVWHGEKLASFRRMFVDRLFTEHPVCAQCTYYYRHDDNIDDFVLSSNG